MVKTKFKRAVSLVMAAVLSLGVFANIGTTAYAASGTKSDVYIMQLPRSGDTNNNGKWGHGELKFMNGWYSHAISTDSLRAMGSYSGNIAYCIEPGTGQHTGDTLTEKNEDYFNNLGSNGTISGDDIRLNIGRILQYGYCGSISTSWKSQNSDDADKLSHAIATQLLIWETIVGERDESFNHKSPGSYDAILDHIQKGHPLYSRIMAYYNSMSESVQKHTKVPSFCTKSSGSAKVNELKWDGSKYVTTLTDSNGVLGNYEFSANIDGVTFSKSGNKLTVSMTKAPSKEFTITATKTNGTRKGIVVWTDGKNSPGNGIQDVVSYSQNVSDPVSGFVKMKVSYGSCKIVKTSEDGKVDGIKFTITGNGVNQTVTTANGGKFQLDNLMLDFVKEAFELEKQKQKDLDIHCEVTIDGYSDFIFINRFGQAQHQATLNKAIRRIIRDCNDEQFEKSEEPEVLLPHFSCHSLRHTFTTRMCEAGVNIKVIQDALGHTDISTTLNIYTDVTKELKTSEFKGLDNYFKAQ